MVVCILSTISYSFVNCLSLHTVHTNGFKQLIIIENVLFVLFILVESINKPILKTCQVTIFDVYETLCPQQMLVHKGGQI